MKKITATLITLNEAAKIGRALSSLKALADEIVVVDSFSTDETLAICRRFTERVYQRSWPGYRAQKQFAVEQASHPWILSLDADEAVGDRLQDEIRRWKQQREESAAGYRLRRRTFFLGRWIDHTSWALDRQVRLFDRSRGAWRGGRVHESVEVRGEIGELAGFLEHYTYSSVSEYLIQLENFSELAAADANDAAHRCGWSELLLLPPFEFLRNFLLLRGFLDGVPGLAVSYLCAVSVFFKYLKLWELQHRLRDSPHPPGLE